MIDHIDHLVLTTTDEMACIRFYVDVLGMTLEHPRPGRKAFRFGSQKIDLQVKGHELELRAHLPVPGALNLCLLANVPLDQVIERLIAMDVPIVEGPVSSARHRTGGLRPSIATAASYPTDGLAPPGRGVVLR